MLPCVACSQGYFSSTFANVHTDAVDIQRHLYTFYDVPLSFSRDIQGHWYIGLVHNPGSSPATVYETHSDALDAPDRSDVVCGRIRDYMPFLVRSPFFRRLVRGFNALRFSECLR